MISFHLVSRLNCFTFENGSSTCSIFAKFLNQSPIDFKTSFQILNLSRLFELKHPLNDTRFDMNLKPIPRLIPGIGLRFVSIRCPYFVSLISPCVNTEHTHQFFFQHASETKKVVIQSRKNAVQQLNGIRNDGDLAVKNRKLMSTNFKVEEQRNSKMCANSCR